MPPSLLQHIISCMADKVLISNLEQRVLRFIRKHGLVSKGQRLLLAVSGGADSVCLLHVMNNLKNTLGIELHVAHLDHQLRGADAEADARYVSDMASRLGIPATVEKGDVAGYRAEHRLSLEEAAREVRYSFLMRVAGAEGCDRVAVGHTLDDHVETVMMHIIRGAGIKGLIGLRPETVQRTAAGTINIIRPLLDIRREETAAYCAGHHLEVRRDASNSSLSLFRNRIRLELLPLLKSYNPQIATALARASRIAGDDLDYIDEQAKRLWSEVALEKDGTIALHKGKFLELSPALQRNLLRMALEKLLGTLKDIEMRHIEEVMAARHKPAGKKIILPFGVVFVIEYNRYLLSRNTARLSRFPTLEGEFAVKVPGETALPGWQVRADIIDSKEMKAGESEFTAYFDIDMAGSALSVRRRGRGDRFQPLGIAQSKKLSEFMADARIPRLWRDSIPIVCSGRHIIWVVGWRIDERVKVTDATGRILRLSFEMTGNTSKKIINNQDLS